MKWSKRLPGRLFELVYEDLIDDRVAKTKVLAAFCGLTWDPACRRLDRRPGVSFTFSRMLVRQPFDRVRIGRWRHHGAELEPNLKALTYNGIF